MPAMSDAEIEAVERAMVAIRRGQTRRTLARLAGPGPGGAGAGFDVLDVIEAADQAGEPATVSAVADALDVDRPRASRLVAAAVEAGLVRRVADQGDGRRVLLAPTRAGRDLVAQAHNQRRSVFAAAMSDWSEEDRAGFARLLTRFVEALAAR
jgi:DNA-binding MarR family transcriptional regulator